MTSATAWELMAQALRPGLGLTPWRLREDAGASRWRGPLAQPDAWVLPKGAAHRHQRLQVLRQVVDRQPDGRWGIEMELRRALAAAAHPALLLRMFLRLDGERVDAAVAQQFPGAAMDVAFDPPSGLAAGIGLVVQQAQRSFGYESTAKKCLEAAIHAHEQLLKSEQTRRRKRRLPGSAVVLGAVDGLPEGAQSPAWVRAAGQNMGPQFAQSTNSVLQGQSGGPQAFEGDPGPTDAATAKLVEPGQRQSSLRTRTASAQAATTWHDEWDFERRAYRRAWTCVHQHPLPPEDLGFLSDLRERHAALSRQIRRRFVGVRSGERQRERRLSDGDLVDLEAAVQAHVARRTGAAALDDRTYEARRLPQRDVAVALLLDMSGSTGFVIPPKPGAATNAENATEEEPEDFAAGALWMGRLQTPAGRSPLNTAAVPKRRVIDVCKDAIGLLCEGLHALGDRHAIFGFSGDGREQVDFYVAKAFDEGWGVQAAARLAAMQPKGSTRTGAAVRHALHLLAREPARRRILVVLSDGYPQDADYHAHRSRPDLPDGHEDRAYGLHDTARALQEAERVGVAAFNLSVDAAANDYLRQMCPKHRYWAIDDVEALPRQMLALYRSMAV